jgi:ubiquinol-cytochrome c reductase iron-sulfur subunit
MRQSVASFGFFKRIACRGGRRRAVSDGLRFWMADLAQSQITGGHPAGADGGSRRDFLLLSAGAIGAVGAAVAVWPFVDSLNPARDTLALSTTEVDLTPVQVGQRLTVAWRGKPVFIDHRTAEEIQAAQDVDVASLRDPQPDTARVKKPEWLVVVGVCTHLGCIPLGNKPGDDRGPFGGWFCPCHGSVYDTSARIRQGPAPLNLFVPPYEFTSDTAVKIG